MELINKLLMISNFEKLNPIQEEAVNRGLLEDKNIIIATPTASGKTFIAEIAAVHTILQKRKKVIYMAPLVALAAEKYNSFRKKYEQLKIKVALSVGDFDNSDPWLRDYDLIICSNEKLDSLIRHNIDWIHDVGLIICDEIHLINDSSRGPTLEVLLTKLRDLTRAKIMALSATIKNVKELADWLNAEYIVSEWRPIKLYEGICCKNKIDFIGWKRYDIGDTQTEVAIAEDTLKMNKQAIFFVATRRMSESLAELLSAEIEKFLTKEEKNQLNEISKKVLNVLERPTEQCKKLANCIKHGVAFHHAGLLGSQKFLIENNFRNGAIKFIVATPTLAMGVSLPAFRVIIRDLKRYYPRIGSSYIPVAEYKQMSGRAGRPEYDKWGESILIAKNKRESERFLEYYIMGETEEIYSKLSIEPILRTHVLSLIASDMCTNKNSLENFFSKTFYASQYGDIYELMERVNHIVDNLINWKFIVQKENSLEATKLGKRVSELYIDPYTAWHFVSCLRRSKKDEPISYLHMIANTLEMNPLPSIRQAEYEKIVDRLAKSHFFQDVPKEWDEEFEEFLKALKVAMIFDDWINEKSAAEILEEYKVTPGELRTRIEIANWLLYSAHELSSILGLHSHEREINKIKTRMKYGVREELLPLIRLKGIGRIKARKLYNNNIKSIADLRKTPLRALESLVGQKTARHIKEGIE